MWIDPKKLDKDSKEKLYFYNGIYWEEDDKNYSNLIEFIDTKYYSHLIDYCCVVLKYKNFKDLKYTGSITINDYNAVAESTQNLLEWKTTYLGVQSTVDYQFYDSFCFFLSARAGLSLSTILRGKQVVDNSVFNLAGNGEFSGLVIQPVIGVYAKYYLSKNGYLSAGLNLSKSVKLGNNPDNVSINNTQILFGGYFDLIKR